MRIQEKIKDWIKKTLKIGEDFVLAHPKDIKNGDYSFFAPAGQANEFGRILSENKIPEIAEVKAVGNFINFYLSKEFFADSVKEIIEKGTVFTKDYNGPRKTIIEYTDPNPFKEFHIGHLMSNSIGEAISRIIEANGAEIKRLSYGGDIGLHVAKSIFGILAKKDPSTLFRTSEIKNIKNADEKEQLKFWADAYVFGNNQYEDDKEAKGKIDELNKIIFD